MSLFTFAISATIHYRIHWRQDTQYNDTQHNDTQNNDTQHIDTQNKDTMHKDTRHNGLNCGNWHMSM